MGVALILFGVGLVELGIAAALKPHLGEAWGDVVAGAIFLLPPLIWALTVISIRPPKASSDMRQVTAALITLLAKETPLIAIIGAGLASVADLFLKRNKVKK
jgi:hypothetical protein